MHRIGIDLGGTKTEGIVLDAHGSEIFRKRIETRREHGYTHILRLIKQLYEELAGHIPGAEHTFGIGTPGAISRRTGLLKNSNTICLNGQPFKTDLERTLGRIIAIENDANCFAMAEALCGAGKGKPLVFGVSWAPGAAEASCTKARFSRARRQLPVNGATRPSIPTGLSVTAASTGCVETFISGGGVEARYFEQYAEKRTFFEIAKDYDRGEPKAVEFMRDFFRHFGRSLANLIDILDPDVVVIGGGVSNFHALYTEGIAQVAKFVFSDSLETPIVKNQLGDSAGVIGAALCGI